MADFLLHLLFSFLWLFMALIFYFLPDMDRFKGRDKYYAIRGLSYSAMVLSIVMAIGFWL